MRRHTRLVIPLLLLLVQATFAELKVSTGYDEGLCLKLGSTNRVSLYTSLGYRSFSADSVYHQPINSFWGKLGNTVRLKELLKLDINFFYELGLLIQNLETDEFTPSGPTLSYNTFDVFGRIGFYPEFFITDKISLGYKFGLEMVHKGNHFELNDAGTGLKDKKDDHFVTGIFGAGSSLFSDRESSPISGLFAHNFVIFINF